MTGINYDHISERFSNSRKNMKWEEISYFMEVLQKSTDKKFSVMDIGCGNGRLLDSLTPLQDKYEYIGIDGSEGMIQEAKNLHTGERFLV